MSKFKNKRKPPKIARWIIGTLNRYQQDFEILGDSEEIFKNICISDGFLKAYFWYWVQTACAFFKYIWFSIKWRLKAGNMSQI